MSKFTKTIIATGASSGIGFEVVKQLLYSTTTSHQPYQFILGARDTARTQAAYDALSFDRTEHSVKILPLELSSLRNVKAFADQALEKLGSQKLDLLFLNAGMIKAADERKDGRGRWCETLVVNHFSQHYLTHLLRPKLEESKTRVVFVSSGAVRNAKDLSILEHDLAAGAGTRPYTVYAESKFIQLLAAHWWRRQLTGNIVVAVSPGLIPNTGIARHSSLSLTMDMPDAKTVPEGAQSLLRAFTCNDMPSDDPERIFLTSWGEWWPKDVYGLTLDSKLQEKWCPGLEEIEKDLDGI